MRSSPEPPVSCGTAALLFVGCVLLSSCGWKEMIAFPDPSGNASIQIFQPRVMNTAGMRIYLSGDKVRALLYESPGQSYVYFAAAYWDGKGRQVAIVVNGSSQYLLAYDTLTRRPIRMTPSLRDGLNRSIAREYGKSMDHDLIQWSWTTEAFGLFRQKHPSAVSR